MSKITTKDDLIKSACLQYNKLFDLLNSLSINDAKKDFTFSIEGEQGAHWQRDKNIKDVLVHLYEWQQLLLNFVNSNMSGNLKPFLPAPYNWKSYGDMNIDFWKNHQNTSYDESIEMLKQSHSNIIKMLDGLTNDELFLKGKLKWTGGSTLGAYFVSTTSSHYEWAMKKIKKHIKTL